MPWIWLEDGSVVQRRNVTRIFIESFYAGEFFLKVSTIGPAMPFAVSHHETRELAEEALKDLVVGRDRSH
jgi:hypothetical protein